MKKLITLIALLLAFAPPAPAKDSALVRRLKREVAGRTYVSEVESEIKVVRRSREFLRQAQRDAAEYNLSQDLHSFFEGQDGFGEVERELLSSLTDVRAYYLGRESEYRVFVGGLTKQGAVVGLSIRVRVG